MSYPFGGHPRFGEYLRWAREEQNCDVQSGYRVDKQGRTHTLTKFSAPSGRWVIEVGLEQDEFLVATTIGRLDRRLGLTSPWFSVDPDNPQDAVFK